MMNRVSDNELSNIVDVIKSQIEKQANKNYTEYKTKCLQELDSTLEAKRNETIKNVLDGIDILMSNDKNYLEPNILIKIEKKIVINKAGDK